MDEKGKLVDRVEELEAALGSIVQLLERNDPGCDEVRRSISSDREVALAIAKRMLERKLG
jgi:DNA-binding FrmR family transcriptional regulator